MSDDESERNWDDGDSAVAMEDSGTNASSLASLSSSLYEHVEENGRTYHRYKSGKYPLPNDDEEQFRLDYQHRLLEMLFEGKHAFAPVDKMPLQNVLDLATGTGRWAVEFADLYPNANIIGTDLSPIQPQYVPPNCSFIVDDAEDEWLFSHPFNYIHARNIVTCFKDGKSVLRSAYSALEPGGYLEIQDPILPVAWGEEPPADSQFLLWNKLSLEAAEAAGRPWTNTRKYEGWMRDLGFEQVTVRKFITPCGTWMDGKREKELGTWTLGNWLQALEAMTTRNLSRINWTPEQCQDLVARVSRELTSGTIKPLMEILVTYGRKPKPSSDEEGDETVLDGSNTNPEAQSEVHLEG